MWRVLCVILLYYVCTQNPIYWNKLHLSLQHLALIIVKLGMMKVTVSKQDFKMNVMKLLRFELHMILCFAFCEKGPFFKSNDQNRVHPEA